MAELRGQGWGSPIIYRKVVVVTVEVDGRTSNASSARRADRHNKRTKGPIVIITNTLSIERASVNQQ